MKACRPTANPFSPHFSKYNLPVSSPDLQQNNCHKSLVIIFSGSHRSLSPAFIPHTNHPSSQFQQTLHGTGKPDQTSQGCRYSQCKSSSLPPPLPFSRISGSVVDHLLLLPMPSLSPHSLRSPRSSLPAFLPTHLVIPGPQVQWAFTGTQAAKPLEKQVGQ